MHIGRHFPALWSEVEHIASLPCLFGSVTEFSGYFCNMANGNSSESMNKGTVQEKRI